MTSGMVGTVAQSKHAQFREGDKVFCYANWATVAQADPAQRQAQVIKLPDEKNIPPSAYLGCLVRAAHCSSLAIGPFCRAQADGWLSSWSLTCRHFPCSHLCVCRACLAPPRTSD